MNYKRCVYFVEGPCEEKLMKAFRKVRTDGYPYLVLADRLLTEYRG